MIILIYTDSYNKFIKLELCDEHKQMTPNSEVNIDGVEYNVLSVKVDNRFEYESVIYYYTVEVNKHEFN